MSAARASLAVFAVVLSSLAITSIASLTAAPARADEFSEFRIPPNRALLWTMGLSGSAGSSDATEARFAGRDGNVSGNAETQARWFSDSDPAFTSLLGFARVNGARSRSEGSAFFNIPIETITEDRNSRSRLTSESWMLAFEHRRYPGRLPLALTVSAVGQGDYGQQWDASRVVDLRQAPASPSQGEVREDSNERWTYRTSLTTGVGLGVGRVRNATGVYDARVIEQRLLSSGALTRSLSATARQSLAELMYVRDAWDLVHDRPGRTLWKEIERILSEDGALADGGLDGYSVLRATEAHIGAGVPSSDGVPRSPIGRLTGIFVGVTLDQNHTRLVDRRDADRFRVQTVDDTVVAESRLHFGLHDERHFDDGRVGLLAEYHRPLGLPWQLSASSRVVVPIRKQQSWLQLDSSAGVDWLVADRWLASASVSQSWFDADRVIGSTPGDYIQLGARATVAYYIEDHLSLSLTANHSQSRAHLGSFLPTGDRNERYARSQSISVGVGYRFAGWLDAPGMFAAATP